MHTVNPSKWGVEDFLPFTVHGLHSTWHHGAVIRKAIKSTMEVTRESSDGFGSGGVIHEPMLLGHVSGSDQPWLGRMSECV